MFPKLRTPKYVRFLFYFVSLSLPANQSVAVELPSSKPEAQGMSSERLERLSKHMANAVEKGVMVGGQAMISRNGKVVYNETWGQRDREANKPMEKDTLHRIYSMTKPITGVAVMMLYEEGHFFLNDPIARYIPELADLEVAVSTADGETKVESDGTTSRTVGEGDTSQAGKTRKPKRQPTIRDLLRHTAGFTYGFFGNTEVDKKYREAKILWGQKDLKEFVTALGKLPLQYEPGTRWHYSVGVDIQGRLVEVISGMSFSEFLQKRIFEPLEMKDTFFVVPDHKVARFAQLYQPKGNPTGLNTYRDRSASTELEVADESANRNYRKGATFQSGGGGLVSTADDYMRFSLMMLNGGELNGKRLLSRKSVELMTVNHLGKLPMGFGRTGAGFGLGFGVALNQGDIGELGSAGEYNWGGAAGTRFWVDPQEKIIGIFMVQSRPHRTRLGREFKTFVYQAVVD
ncbi:MAG: serine hydrolase domain-containing protein [Pseudomonadota bacterium]